MGLHSGVTSASEMVHSRTTQFTAYTGAVLQLAKAVSDAAAGGMVSCMLVSPWQRCSHVTSPWQPLCH
jgi:hypothetical protein